MSFQYIRSPFSVNSMSPWYTVCVCAVWHVKRMKKKKKYEDKYWSKTTGIVYFCFRTVYVKLTMPKGETSWYHNHTEYGSIIYQSDWKNVSYAIFLHVFYSCFHIIFNTWMFFDCATWFLNHNVYIMIIGFTWIIQFYSHQNDIKYKILYGFNCVQQRIWSCLLVGKTERRKAQVKGIPLKKLIKPK